MPLDDDSRSELQRLLRVVPRLLSFGLNPIGAVVGWLMEPAPPRSRRRVYLTADGHVIRTEQLPPKPSRR
jgi:hypothetical protein